MQKSRGLLLSGIAIFTLSGAYGEALAQDSASDIVVTARRQEERLQDVPISITVFNQEQLSQRNITNANDLASFTPSLTSNARFGSENATFAIRGFVQQGLTSPSVAVYFADVVALRAQSPTGAAGNGAGPGSFFDLQNVQVLKGPQGTLFGRNTTGGAILLVPQRPTDAFDGYVEASVGNYDMNRFQGVINLPMAENLRFRVGADYQKRDGYVRNRSEVGPKDFSDVNYVALRASLLWDVTPNIENYTIGTYSLSKTNGMVPRVIATFTGPNCAPGPAATGGASLLGPLICSQQLARAAKQGYGYYDVENNVANPYQNIEQFQIINTTTWMASDTLTVKNIASYGEYRQEFASNSFGDNISLPASFGPLAGRPFGYVTNYQNGKHDFVSQKTFTDEVQLQGRVGENFSFQLGGYYEKATPLGGYQSSIAPILLSCIDATAYQCIDVLRNPVTGAPGGFIQVSRSKYTFENLGFYAQGTYNFIEKASITGGIRYTVDKTRANAATQTIIFPVPNAPFATCSAFPGRPATMVEDCENIGDQKSKRPTWLIGLDYKPVEDVLLYTKYARGYRQGGVDAGNSVVISWGPEKVDSYEIGAKASFNGPVRGYFNAAGFYNDFTHQQLAAALFPDGSVPNAAPAQTIVNAGTSRIKGLEVEAGLDPMDGLRLTAGYTYLDAKLKSYSAPIIPGYQRPQSTSEVGSDLTMSPKHKLTAGISYRLPLSQSSGRITIGGTYNYTSSQLSTAATAPQFQRLPATHLVNLSLDWKNFAGKPVDLSLFATNITNEKYPFASGGGYFSQGSETYILGEPRMYGGRIRVHFGG